ncbi:hypothetical protein [Rhizobium leguminosarum]|jgi:hypothetical protein|uniref:hypothetical protein n=1 Tax=Rhizobium leguminosarum TaxID=384 RepID=UPI001FE08C68|nr:hypothetical protein [Rhizobium leguminosarum]
MDATAQSILGRFVGLRIGKPYLTHFGGPIDIGVALLLPALSAARPAGGGIFSSVLHQSILPVPAWSTPATSAHGARFTVWRSAS